MEVAAQDFTLTCRFCTRHEESNINNTLQLQSIYDYPPGHIGVLTIFHISAATMPWLVISAKDGLPQVTCKSCVERLLEVQKFQQMCIQSEKTLQAIGKSNAAIIIKEELDIKEEFIWTELEFEDKPLPVTNEHQENMVPDEPLSKVLHDNKTNAAEETSNSSANKQKSFTCNECGKQLATAARLKDHLLRHKNVRNFECPICPKTFNTKINLAQHKKIHNDVKKHVCDICGAAFNQTNLLKVHKKRHTEEKTHKCEHCDKRFVLYHSLRLHLRTHTGEKPYKCKYCEYACATQGNLMLHLRKHLGMAVFNCELCTNSYRTATELRKHFTEHRNEDAVTREKNRTARQIYEAKLKIFFNMSPLTLDL